MRVTPPLKNFGSEEDEKMSFSEFVRNFDNRFSESNFSVKQRKELLGSYLIGNAKSVYRLYTTGEYENISWKDLIDMIRSIVDKSHLQKVMKAKQEIKSLVKR